MDDLASPDASRISIASRRRTIIRSKISIRIIRKIRMIRVKMIRRRRRRKGKSRRRRRRRNT